MTDVFISYASEDRDRAKALANLLVASGWSVWWDRSIIIGEAFDQAIERELEAARCVVVLWSIYSIGSEWVKNEAAVAAARGVLVPAKIDDVKIPLEFRRRQTADLMSWRGDSADDGFQALCKGIATAKGTVQPLQTPVSNARTLRDVRRLAITLLTLGVAGFGFYFAFSWRDTQLLPFGFDKHNTVNEQEANRESPLVPVELADLVVGSYYGDVISDSKGGGLSDVIVFIRKLDRRTVRITSDYERLGSVEITLSRSKIEDRDWIMSVGGDSVLIIELNKKPVAINYNPHLELAYSGSKL